MTFFEHKTVFWVALWPCLAVFCVAYGAICHQWFVASIAGVWILVAGQPHENTLNCGTPSARLLTDNHYPILREVVLH